MTTQFITEYLDNKIAKDENFITCSFFDLKVKYNFNEDEINRFLELAKIRLENLNYQVYFTDDEYTYNGIIKKVEPNQLMVAVKKGENNV